MLFTFPKAEFFPSQHAVAFYYEVKTCVKTFLSFLKPAKTLGEILQLVEALPRLALKGFVCFRRVYWGEDLTLVAGGALIKSRCLNILAQGGKHAERRFCCRFITRRVPR